MEASRRGDSFADFSRYFSEIGDNGGRQFTTLNGKLEQNQVKIHPGKFENIRRNLESASEFFDNQNAISLKASDILQKTKMSVIDVASRKFNTIWINTFEAIGKRNRPSKKEEIRFRY